MPGAAGSDRLLTRSSASTFDTSAGRCRDTAALTALTALTALVCVAGPLLAAAAVTASGAVPADTLFGQWLHESGFALPMVMLAFAGQWLLPLLASIVAGDIFAAEDHFGTWKTPARAAVGSCSPARRRP